MSALPTVGGNSGTWGQVLNDYLTTEHTSTGTHGLSTGLVTDVVNTQTLTENYTLPTPTTAGIHNLTLSASISLTFPTAVAGQSFTIIIHQGSGGSKLVTWPGTVFWASGTAPTLSTIAAQIDILGFFTDGTNWFGFVSGQNMAVPS